MKSKYINTFDTTAEYDAYIESALPQFPNVGYDKQAGVVNIRRQSPNDYQIWGTTTATSNFNIKLNDQNVEVTVDPLLGEFYLTGWTGTLTNLQNAFYENDKITSIKKFAIDTSNVTNMSAMFQRCSSLTSLNLFGVDISSLSSDSSYRYAWMYGVNSLTDVYIDVEATLMKLTDNLSSQGSSYIPSSATIHYNDVDYVWSGSAWTIQS